MYGRKREILQKRFYIFSAQNTLIRTVDDLGQKSNGNVLSILHIFHESGMKNIGISKQDIAGFHMVSTLVYFIKNLSIQNKGDFQFWVPVP